MPEHPGEQGNPLFLVRGQEEALGSQFCLFLRHPQADVPASVAGSPGEGSRALLNAGAGLSSSSCWETPEPQITAEGKYVKQRFGEQEMELLFKIITNPPNGGNWDPSRREG